MNQFTFKQTLMALFVPFLWGLGFVFAKGAINHFPPILLMAFRFLLTALVLVWFVPIPKGKFVQIFKIAIVAAAIQYSLTFTGVKGLEAGLASIIVQLEVPFLVLLGAFFLKEKVTKPRAIHTTRMPTPRPTPVVLTIA